MWKIDLKSNQQLFFTSDSHYNHTNICRGVSKWTGDLTNTTRNYANLKDMNDMICDQINSMVGEDDILIHLGDWSFGGFDSIREFRERIVCKNIYLILGNHDHHIEDNKENIQDLFVDVKPYSRLQVKTQQKHPMFPVRITQYVLSHYPIASWDKMNKGVIHLFGHVHLPNNKKIMSGKSMDVGVDGNDLCVYNHEQILRLLKDNPCTTTVIPSDHHSIELKS